MGVVSNLRNRFSNYVYKRSQRSGVLDEWMNALSTGSIRWGGAYVDDESVLKSSDVYELLNDISSQVAMAKPVVIGPDGKDVPNHKFLQLLKQPNNYLTGYEYSVLETNALLMNGEVFPIYLGNELHLANNVFVDLDNHLIEHYKINGEEIPATMMEHIKRIGGRAMEGQGLSDLGRNTLNGVMNAEKVLTDKYTKGGVMAFLLKLDAQINPQNSSQSKLVKAVKNSLAQINSADDVKIVPLGRGYDIEALESPVDDQKILAYLDVYKKDLGKFLGINVDTYQAMMKTDIEKAMMYLHNKVVKPILENRAEHYTKLLFGRDSRYRVEWRINILDFVPYSTKTNIGYNIVRTGITTPDAVAEMLGFEPQNTPETQAVYISNDLSKISNATDDSLPTKGGDKDAKDSNADSKSN